MNLLCSRRLSFCFMASQLNIYNEHDVAKICHFETRELCYTVFDFTVKEKWNFQFICTAMHTDGSLSLVHTSSISIRERSIRKQTKTYPLGLAKTKQQEFFFVSSFVRRLTYGMIMTLCLWYQRSLCRRLNFLLLFCLLFCPYAYAHVWTRP